MENIKILIIVPTLNASKYLERLTIALNKQVFQNWRVLFIDGESEEKHRNWIINFCRKNSKFNWMQQSKESIGIYGAMNNGIVNANANEWLLFWGADDYPASNETLLYLVKRMEKYNYESLDLIVGNGKYISMNNVVNRKASFIDFHKDFLIENFKKFLFLGHCPPHQCTLFSNRLFNFKSFYNTNFKLAADLDYFLSIRNKKDLKVLNLNLDIVRMGDAGISAKNTLQRLREVANVYWKAYKLFWIFPFIFRYFFRVIKLI